jgi:peptidyl-prolyl cis-trans isomerase C
MALAACSGAPVPTPSALPSPGAQASAGAIDVTTPLPDPLPDVAARVNGQAVPIGFVNLMADEMLKGRSRVKDRSWAYRTALQRLIERELLVEEALARGVSADDKRVQQIYNESRIHYKDEDDWATYLANEGVTRDALRAQIRAQLMAQALIDHEASLASSQVTDEEARAFYDSHPSLFESGERLDVSQILLRVPPPASATQAAMVRRQAEALLARVRKGEDFAKLAKEYSQDEATAAKGGEMARFGHGQVDPIIEKAAFALQPGEVSGVVGTLAGFHLLKVRKRVPSEHLAYEPLKDGIRQYIVADRRRERVVKLVESLRAKARIETFL